MALALVPVIAARIARGVRDGELPLYRTRFDRADGETKFRLLLGLHGLSLVLMLTIAAELLFDLGLGERL